MPALPSSPAGERAAAALQRMLRQKERQEAPRSATSVSADVLRAAGMDVESLAELGSDGLPLPVRPLAKEEQFPYSLASFGARDVIPTRDTQRHTSANVDATIRAALDSMLQFAPRAHASDVQGAGGHDQQEQWLDHDLGPGPVDSLEQQRAHAAAAAGSRPNDRLRDARTLVAAARHAKSKRGLGDAAHRRRVEEKRRRRKAKQGGSSSPKHLPLFAGTLPTDVAVPSVQSAPSPATDLPRPFEPSAKLRR